MQHDADHRHRQSLRLAGYDYHSAGAYFVTLCTRQRECLLDDPIVTEILTKVWSALPVRFPTIALDELAVMPNHVHLIVWLRPPSMPPQAGAPVAVAPTLGQVIGAFKSLVFTTYRGWIEAHDPARPAAVWQRNYYEHVIRNEQELHAIRCYIRNNPDQWAMDRDNPLNLRRLPPPTCVESYLDDMRSLLMPVV